MSPEYQSATRNEEADFCSALSTLGAVCSLASAQQSVSQGEMDKQKGISLKLTARGQE